MRTPKHLKPNTDLAASPANTARDITNKNYQPPIEDNYEIEEDAWEDDQEEEEWPDPEENHDTTPLEVWTDCPACELVTSPHPMDSPPRWEYHHISPELAQHLVDTHNTENRPVAHYVVEALVKDIQLGQFSSDNGDTVTFDRNGVLMDGQHRLMALVQAKKTVRLMLVLGIDPTDRDTIDCGKPRSARDVATFSGYLYPGTQMAIAKLAMLAQAGRFVSLHGHSAMGFTVRARHEFLRQNTDKIWAATKLGNRFHIFNLGAARTGFLAYLGVEQDELKLLRFLHIMRKCAPATQWESPDIERHPAYHLHFLLARNQDSRAKRSEQDIMRFALKAWLLDRQNREISLLRILETDKLQTLVTAAAKIPKPHYSEIDLRALAEIRKKVEEMPGFYKNTGTP